MEKRYEADDEIEIDLWEIFYALKARLWAILLALFLGGSIATAYSKVILTPQYTSTSMVYILSKETTLTSLADLQLGSQLAKDYKVLVTSRPVLQEVIDTLELDMGYGVLKGALVLNNPGGYPDLKHLHRRPGSCAGKGNRGQRGEDIRETYRRYHGDHAAEDY